MRNEAVEICLLYPDLLGTYGDGGNATVLERRLQWRDIPVNVVRVNMGDAVPDSSDIYVMGGGEDQPQTAVTDHLMASRALHRAVDKGATVFAVCAGMQVLGESFAISGDRIRDGLGLLDVTTVRGEGERRVGEITVAPSPEFGAETLTGYENHGGVTMLGTQAKALGRVLTGRGNDDGKGSEGAVQGKIVATYLHGPVLARNPHLADRILEWAVGAELQGLDDDEVTELRNERLRAARRSVVSATFPQRVKSLLKRS